MPVLGQAEKLALIDQVLDFWVIKYIKLFTCMHRTRSREYEYKILLFEYNSKNNFVYSNEYKINFYSNIHEYSRILRVKIKN